VIIDVRIAPAARADKPCLKDAVVNSDAVFEGSAREYQPGHHRFRDDGQWRNITDQDIDTAECRCRRRDPFAGTYSPTV
jgi:hypothetical protein